MNSYSIRVTTLLPTALIDRRKSGGADRRRIARGGRRATDLVRASGFAFLLSVLGASLAHAQPSVGWTTSEAKILTPASGQFVITGVNWYGFETVDKVAHGLWSKDYKFIIDQIKQYGYNTIRVAYSNEMWETNPVPASNLIGGCPACAGKRARDMMALIINYAGSIGLHVILDNHRSTAGNSAQESGLWYTSGYPEQAWIRDWLSVQEWIHGIPQTLGGADTITVNRLASDGYPVVLGFDLRNEPHSPSSYMSGSTWGTGDSIDPRINPNPNPFTPACVAASSCHDWRLAAERAATTILGEAFENGWEYPLIFVEGISKYPVAGGTATSGPYSGYWWGGNLLGLNGNSTNPGAPVVLNAGGNAAGLGPPVYTQLVYSAHDYGPATYAQSWFNSSTCYTAGCSASSLASMWNKYWAHLNLAGGINPVWPGQPAYPWSNTGHVAVSQAPVYIGEFGTPKLDSDLFFSGAGSRGQWFTGIVNFIQSSYQTSRTATNDSGIPVTDLNWTYWALNNEDPYGILGGSYAGLANAKKEYSFLCFIQQGTLALPRGSSAGQCGSTGILPLPDGGVAPPPVVAPAAPTGLAATPGNGSVTLAWTASTGATSYTVKSSTTNGGPYLPVVSGVTTTSALVSGTNGVTYYYVVSATNAGGESPNSSQVSARPAAPVVAPLAPTGLTATAGNASVTLAWTASTGATSYTVKSSTTSGGPYLPIATATTTAAVVAGTNGVTYYYVVSATNAGGESSNSSQVSARPAAPVVVPLAPTGLTATAGNASVTLAWTASTGATSYTVKSSTTSGGPYLIIATATTTSAVVAGTNGVKYYYVVSATNSAGSSPNSSQVSATPTAPVITNLSIWWPADGAKVSGTQPFKARISSLALTDYTMYWQVDGGQLNLMWDSYKDAPHKEASVNVSSWKWRGNGPYVITFVAKNRALTQVLAQKSVRIYIAR